MTLFAFFASLGAFCIALAKGTACPKPLAPLVALCSIVLLLEFGGFFGVLNEASYAIYYASFLAGLSVFILSFKRSGFQKTVLWLLNFKSLWFFLGVSYLLYKVSVETAFFEYDVFSHWGLAAKDYAYRNHLVDPQSSIFYQNYPPGTTLWQYFVSSHLGFSEQNTIWANGVLLASGLPIAFDAGKTKRPLSAYLCLILLMGFFIVSFHTALLGFPLLTGYVDSILGALFFFAAIGTFEYGRRKGQLWLFLIPVFWFLPIVKQSGFVFCGFACSFLAMHSLLEFLLKKERTHLFKTVLICISLLGTCVASKKIWDVYTIKSGIIEHIGEDRFTTYPKLETVVTAFTSKASESQQSIKKKFLTQMSTPLLEDVSHFKVNRFLNYLKAPFAKIPSFSPILWLAVILLLLQIAAWQSGRTDNKELHGLSLAFVACTLAYTFIQLLAYMFIFSESEGLGLASFGRYFGSFLMGTSLFASAILYRTLQGKRAWLWSLLVPASLIFLQTPSKAQILELTNDTGPKWLVDSRYVIRRDTAPAKKTPPESKIFVLYAGGLGYLYLITRYELSPRHVSPNQYSEFNGTTAEFAKLLKDYDYLYVAASEPGFFKRHSDLFTSQDVAGLCVWQVEKNSSKPYGIQLVAKF